eukprot:106664-Chlamydomonas_euryale.AAC.1
MAQRSSAAADGRNKVWLRMGATKCDRGWAQQSVTADGRNHMWRSAAALLRMSARQWGVLRALP